MIGYRVFIVKETYQIKDLEQVRLLADPFKLQLIQSFAESAKTAKQVAEELGESVTRLYRHVDALYEAGLLDIVEEKQKRGTIERTFRAVAQRFEADHALFSDDAGPDGRIAAREMLRVSETEILDALSNSGNDDEEQAIIMRIRGRANPEKIAELRATLQEWLESVPNADESESDDYQEFGGFVAFYKVD